MVAKAPATDCHRIGHPLIERAAHGQPVAVGGAIAGEKRGFGIAARKIGGAKAVGSKVMER